MEIKYTTDGKKVKVIGSLNNQQKIVQEIFITNDGSEIPSGENFVVTSLHEAPVESWKEKKLRELETNFDSTRRKLENDLKILEENYSARHP